MAEELAPGMRNLKTRRSAQRAKAERKLLIAARQGGAVLTSKGGTGPRRY